MYLLHGIFQLDFRSIVDLFKELSGFLGQEQKDKLLQRPVSRLSCSTPLPSSLEWKLIYCAASLECHMSRLFHFHVSFVITQEREDRSDGRFLSLSASTAHFASFTPPFLFLALFCNWIELYYSQWKVNSVAHFTTRQYSKTTRHKFNLTLICITVPNLYLSPLTEKKRASCFSLMGWNVVNLLRPYQFYSPVLFPPALFTRLLFLKRQKIHFKGPLIQDGCFK